MDGITIVTNKVWVQCITTWHWEGITIFPFINTFSERRVMRGNDKEKNGLNKENFVDVYQKLSEFQKT
jgi:hypothetical protein